MAVVLVTGSSSGFGLLTATELARRGHTVAATMREVSRDGALRAALDAAGLAADVVRLDISDRASVDDAVRTVIDRNGRIDAVVNNAGVAHGAPIEELDLDDLAAVFDTNVLGQVRVIQSVLPIMRAQRRGHIVNVTSVAAFVSPPFMGSYAASKHAMDAIGEALATEVAPFGIHVTNVAPAAYDTPMVSTVTDLRSRVVPDSPYASRLTTLLDRHERSMRKNSDPSEVARAVADAIDADPPPARVVVPDSSSFAVQARGATPPEQMRELIAQSYGIADSS